MKQITFYGKGGIGKSTTAANVAAALAQTGLRVLQMGCDPKHDSTITLVNGTFIPTVLDTVRKVGTSNIYKIKREDVVFEGEAGILCVEAGGPQPGVGCGGRGIITAVNVLEELGVYDEDIDIWIYDVLGDVVCGGFAVPIREGFAETVYLVTSGELMALYAANNICVCIASFAQQSGVRLGGVILNCRGLPQEEEVSRLFAEKINSRLVGVIPRDNRIRDFEVRGRTVVMGAPESDLAQLYREMASRIANNNEERTIPTPFEFSALREFYKEYLDSCDRDACEVASV